MKILYFDCFNGVSLNLILSAFIDAGVTKEHIRERMCEHSFEIICKKNDDDIIPSVKADIKVFEEKTLTEIEAMELAQNIVDDNERCFVIMALKKLKKLKMSQYLKIRAIIIAFLSIEVNYAISSHLIDGDKNTSVDVLEIIKNDNLPYKTLSDHDALLFPCGVSIISTLTKEYGPIPELDIIKIAYGTDGERYLRIVIGTLKRKSVSDFFEMSLDFNKDSVGVFACGEDK